MSKPNHSQPAGQPRPLVLVFVEGGLVSDILADSPVDIRVIDYDNGGDSDECDTVDIPMLDGKAEKASVGCWNPTPTIRRVHQIWRAIDRRMAKQKAVA